MNDIPKQKTEELLERIRTLVDVVNQRTHVECEKVVQIASSGNLELSGEEITVLRTIHSLPDKVPFKRIVGALASAKGGTLQPSTVSAIMSRFKKYGLIIPEKNQNDKRQPLNSLTPLGKQLAHRLNEVDEMAIRSVLNRLHLEDGQVVDLIRHLDKAIERVTEQLQQLQKQTKASIAGLYDYALGGSWNSVVDRMWADTNKIPPQRRDSAPANRAFLQRAVHYLAKYEGIRQFIDIGSGFPTNRNTHEVLSDLNCVPAPHVTYVDNDPDVVRVSHSILSEMDAENVRIVREDVRFVDRWLEPDRFQNIDLEKPVAVLLIAVLHFVMEDAEVRRILQFLKRRLAPGSYLAISHSTPDTNPDEPDSFTSTYNRQVTGVKQRSAEELATLLDGFDLVDSKPVFISDWKPKLPDMLNKAYISKGTCSFVACVAKT